MPFFFEAAILSRMRSPVTSRSNWAKDNRTLRVSRPIEVVVLNCCVTVSSVLRFSRIMGFENSLVGIPANHSAGASPG
jgi:hypothetical protein